MKKCVKETIRAIPWMAVFLILLVGGLVSIGICFCNGDRKEDYATAASIQEQNKTCQVTFLQEDGTVLEVKEVAYGESVMPPLLTSEKEGKVFRGWTTNFSRIVADMEAVPIFHDLSGEKNVLFMDTCYEESGKDISIELKLGGRVKLSGMKITLTYDPKVLAYLESEVLLDNTKVTKSDDGILEIVIDEKENLTEPISLLRMKYHVEDVDFILTYLELSMKEPRKIEGGTAIGTDSTAVNGKIFIY